MYKRQQEEVLKRAQAIAALHQIPLDQFIKDLQKRNAVNELFEQIAHEKALDIIEKSAKIEDIAPPGVPA